MRIRYKYGITALGGNLDGLLHTGYNQGNVTIGRITNMPHYFEPEPVTLNSANKLYQQYTHINTTTKPLSLFTKIHQLWTKFFTKWICVVNEC